MIFMYNTIYRLGPIYRTIYIIDKKAKKAYDHSDPDDIIACEYDESCPK